MSHLTVHRSREEGSAYLLTLLVILILTLVGLTLSLVTQSERLIGFNEQLSQRVFNAANSGVDIATAKALVVPDMRPMSLDFVEPSNDPGWNFRHRVAVSPLIPVERAPCNLCQIDDTPFGRINHTVAATATRIGWSGNPATPPATPVPLAQQQIALLMSFQPWWNDGAALIRGTRDGQRHRGGILPGS